MQCVMGVLAGLRTAVQAQPLAAALTVGLIVVTLFVTQALVSNVPGPKFCVPLLGDTLTCLKNPAAYFLQGYLRYGGVYRTSLFGRHLYCVLEPSAVREVLRGDDSTFSVPFGAFSKLLNDWDHMVDGPLHDYWRKAVSIGLSPQAIERYLPALEQTIKKALAAWADQGTVSLMDASADLAIEFAMDVLVGVKFQLTDREWFKAQLLQYLAGLYCLPIPFPGTTFNKAQLAKRNLEAALAKELEAQVTAMQQKHPSASELADTSHALRHLDGAQKVARLTTDPLFHLDQSIVIESLSRLKFAKSSSMPIGASLADTQLEVLQVQRRLTLQNVADRMLGLFIAATDTTRFTIFTIMAILDKFPEEVEKLRQEQHEVTSKHGDQVTSAALSAMKLLDASVREANRLLPSSRIVIRQALRDLRVQDVRVPAGAHIIFSVDCQHCLEPALWQGPDCIPPGSLVPTYMDWRNNLQEAFQPSRWLGDNVPKHMLTFGGGSHKCIGMNLVYAETKLFLSLLIRGYAWMFEDPSMLAKCVTSPGIRPAPHTDTLHIARR